MPLLCGACNLFDGMRTCREQRETKLLSLGVMRGCGNAGRGSRGLARSARRGGGVAVSGSARSAPRDGARQPMPGERMWEIMLDLILM